MDFYKSRKFWYHAVTFVAAVVMALVPVMLNLSADNAGTFRLMVPILLGTGFFLSSGHSLMDALSLAKGFQVPGVDEALKNVVDSIEKP